MAQIISNVKRITSNTTPTTTNLTLGQLAFGKVDGVYGIYGNSENEVVNLITSALPESEIVSDVTYNGATAEMTITKMDDSTSIINLPKENFLASASYDADTHILTLTLVDGTEVEVDMGDLIDVYIASAAGGLEVTNGNEFGIKVAGVTLSMLEAALQSKLNTILLTGDGTKVLQDDGSYAAITLVVEAI